MFDNDLGSFMFEVWGYLWLLIGKFMGGILDHFWLWLGDYSCLWGYSFTWIWGI